MSERKIISRFLDTDGDGTGTKNANGNYSGAAEEFFIAPDEGEDWTITRMLVNIADEAVMQAEEYGNLGAALTNGVKVEVHNDSGLVYSLTDPNYPVKTNAGWAAYMFDVHLLTWGSGDELLNGRWTFAKSGVPVRLRSRFGEKLVVTVNDNLTGLLNHQFLVQGYEGEWIP